MFFLCCCFIRLLLLVSAWAGVIMEITDSDVAYMASVRSLIANLLMLPSGYGNSRRRLAGMQGMEFIVAH